VSAAGAAAAGAAEPAGRPYMLHIAYDGTDYSGWQLQPAGAGKATVQGALECALTTLTRSSREALGVRAAGRTDAGVHAAGQVVQFFSADAGLDAAGLLHSLNRLLPHDIRALSLSAAAPDWDVIHSSLGKLYRYELDLGGGAWDPLAYRFRAQVPAHRLDVPAMRAAAALFVGRHDFTQFSNDGPERLRRNPVKTIASLELAQEGRLLAAEVSGDGFLHKQARCRARGVGWGEGAHAGESVYQMAAQMPPPPPPPARSSDAALLSLRPSAPCESAA